MGSLHWRPKVFGPNWRPNLELVSSTGWFHAQLHSRPNFNFGLKKRPNFNFGLKQRPKNQFRSLIWPYFLLYTFHLFQHGEIAPTLHDLHQNMYNFAFHEYNSDRVQQLTHMKFRAQSRTLQCSLTITTTHTYIYDDA